MALLTVPTSTEPFYDQISELDGINYLLGFRYNQREDRWYLSISEESGTPIITGIKLVCNWPLTGGFHDARLPPGVLTVLSAIDANQAPPGFDEIGPSRRCELHYLPATEATAAIA
jgi:hypothetical protein